MLNHVLSEILQIKNKAEFWSLYACASHDRVWLVFTYGFQAGSNEADIQSDRGYWIILLSGNIFNKFGVITFESPMINVTMVSLGRLKSLPAAAWTFSGLVVLTLSMY